MKARKGHRDFDLEEISPVLLQWFDSHGRELPWRKEGDPFPILLAETMLQRTRAEQVAKVYPEVVTKYPTPDALGSAPLKQVQAIYERLGLRWRAPLIKKMAETLSLQYAGVVPHERAQLLALPAVGEYVADAVLCFAFGQDVAVVDSNVCRVLIRYFDLNLRGEARRNPHLRALAQSLVPQGMARKYNWAIIDLASSICTPSEPLCQSCPLLAGCSYPKKNH